MGSNHNDLILQWSEVILIAIMSLLLCVFLVHLCRQRHPRPLVLSLLLQQKTPRLDHASWSPRFVVIFNAVDKTWLIFMLYYIISKNTMCSRMNKSTTLTKMICQ
ncbi:hypothetical protein BDB00DRAFT_822904 [Zychaea mexicana]|uniref:uncharacterized protein n=1 Tax=Zychaea mexicana TaxID=64656 RepID=UPI0022FEAED9|nr:uncharacterized protein BDB00DRAFT_822904 [Zychaea mexicana]KAI9493618.1 hypothetical protein BDB00DRAFT_822904 [Zychaea mexicana]